jgi:hypothetical protein
LECKDETKEEIVIKGHFCFHCLFFCVYVCSSSVCV